jgi:uncharacterized NAD-dependent epimerase/dehydratase family protein
MIEITDGNALVYCEGAFNTTNGKTAHGLVRFTQRYRIVALIDSHYAGKDAGEVLDGQSRDIPIFASIEAAYSNALARKLKPDYLVVGLAPDGGRLDPMARNDIKKALEKGMNVDSGLHDFISDDPEFSSLATEKNLIIRDIRKTPPRDKLHFFSGKIEKVNCVKIAVLGTDSAIGKRTTAWILVNALKAKGYKAELIGTGQTAWMQGVKYGFILDSLINDFVSGEIEHAVYEAWQNERPDVIVLEGQGSLLNPAYPGGFELLAAGRPDYVILQHAPARKEYDGFPGYELHSLQQQIEAIEIISGKKVVAITINHEGLDENKIREESHKITFETGLFAVDVLKFGSDKLLDEIIPLLKK